MPGKIVFTAMSMACLLAATAASAQQAASTEPAAAASSQTNAPTAEAGSSPRDTSTDSDIDFLLQSSGGTDAAVAPQATPASPSSEAIPAAPAPADNAAIAPSTDDGSIKAAPTGEGAADSGATYAAIAVPLKKDQPDAATQPLPKPPSQLEEIVVTATKRPELVRDIPATIAVLTGQKLEEMGAHELKDFIQSVPGINTQDEIAGLQRKLSVRGVAPQTGTNQTVGIVYGDVALTDPYGSYTIADPDPWDLSTVEVMKGPQGTLFGATSLSGVIRYVPNSPKLGEWKGLLSADWIHIDQGATEPSFGAVLNVPVGETIAFRFAGSWQHKPGVIDIINPSYNKIDADEGYTRTGRAMALWQPTEKLTLNAWYIKGQRNSEELNFISNDNRQYLREDSPGPSPVSNGYTLGTLDARYEFDWATLVSISAYQTKNSFNDADSSELIEPLAKLGIRTLHGTRKVDTSGYQQELRLVSPNDGPWTWIGGAYISTYKADITSVLYAYPGLAALAGLLDTLPPAVVASLYDPGKGLVATTNGLHPVDASEKALFGELSRTLWDDLKVTLGGRFYSVKVSGTSVTNSLNPTNNGAHSISTASKGFSPKASAAWHIDDDIMVYGTVSRGFQYGGFNTGVLSSVPATFKSSTLWNYETGVRTDWLDRTLRFDLTGFYDVWKNPQVHQVTQDKIGSYTDNVGAARVVGAETTLNYATPIPGVTLETSASYIVATTTETFDDASGKTVEPGTLLPSSPKLQATTTLSYTNEFSAWRTQTALTHSYQGHAWNDVVHSVEVGGYNVLNLSFAVSRNDLAFTPNLTFQVNNLTNVDALSSALGGTDAIPGNPDLSHQISPRLYVLTQPRNFRLNLSLKF